MTKRYVAFADWTLQLCLDKAGELGDITIIDDGGYDQHCEAQSLFAQRSKLIEKLLIAEYLPGTERPDNVKGNLGITIFGSYQDDDFVAEVRPWVVMLLRRQIHEIDERIVAMGVMPPAISAVPEHILERLGK